MKPHHIVPRLHGAVLGLLLCASLAPSMASAQSDRASLERLHQTTLGILESLVNKGLLTKADMEAILQQAAAKASAKEAEAPPAQAAESATVRVPFVPEVVKRELRDQIRQEVMAQAKSEGWAQPGSLPEWINRLQVSGDIRVRYQTDRMGGNNAPAAQYFDSEDITNFAGLRSADIDQNRLRLRARLAISSQLSDNVHAGMRITTGNQTSPVSSSSTAGDASNRFGIKLDRAFIRYSPLEFLTLELGRINNPFLGAELVYAPDMGFDGVAASFRPKLAGPLKPFATLGVFPLKNDTFSGNRRLVGAQLGAEWQASEKVGLKFAVAQYRFDGAAGKAMVDRFDPAYNSTEYESGYRQRGNTLFRINQDPFVTANPVYGLASDFNINSLFASVELRHFDPMRLTLTAESIINKGFDSGGVAARVGITGIDSRNRGYLVKLTAGHPRIEKRGDWQVGFGVRKLERDATLDALTDPDFVLGGTNVKGQVFSFVYGIDKRTELGLRYLSGETIDAPLHNTGLQPLRVRTMQMDMSVRF